MKYLLIFASLLSLVGCKTKTTSLQVQTIFSAPQRVTREVPETKAQHSYTTFKAVTERLVPAVYFVYKEDPLLIFRLQGNISSGGHNIRNVSKIRFEKGEQWGNSIALKYYVMVKHIPGKESANIMGYNYSIEQTYQIPDDVKVIKVELYEEHPNTEAKLIAENTFDFLVKI